MTIQTRRHPLPSQDTRDYDTPCGNCGERLGAHGHPDDACPQGADYSATYRFTEHVTDELL